ncbi:hypothetical protein B5P42_31340, partial [Bacillus sp. SRB_331]
IVTVQKHVQPYISKIQSEDHGIRDDRRTAGSIESTTWLIGSSRKEFAPSSVSDSVSDAWEDDSRS